MTILNHEEVKAYGRKGIDWRYVVREVCAFLIVLAVVVVAVWAI